jgi:hypothetical protein
MFTFIRTWFGNTLHTRPRAVAKSGRPVVRPRLEALEDRTVPALTAQEHFVQALYVADLGRTGSLGELDTWVMMLNRPGSSQAMVAGAIANSLEAREDLVRGWYQTFLGRMPQSGEEMGWVNMLQMQTREQVLSQILGSAEFISRAQSLAPSGTSAQRFVEALYQLLLGRTASPMEIAGWVDKLQTIGARGVAMGLLQSMEYRADVVTTDYLTLLHRSPAMMEVNSWASSGMDLGMVRVNIESSMEFFTNG